MSSPGSLPVERLGVSALGTGTSLQPGAGVGWGEWGGVSGARSTAQRICELE